MAFASVTSRSGALSAGLVFDTPLASDPSPLLWWQLKRISGKTLKAMLGHQWVSMAPLLDNAWANQVPCTAAAAAARVSMLRRGSEERTQSCALSWPPS